MGNYIGWADGEGTVQSIILRVTRVLTPDGELVTVPNTVLTEETITRPYRWERYRIVEPVGIDYEDDMADAIARLEAATEDLDVIADAPTPKVYIDELAPDSVVIDVHYWIEDPGPADVFAVRSAYAEEIKTRLDAAGITINPPSKRDLQANSRSMTAPNESTLSSPNGCGRTQVRSRAETDFIGYGFDPFR